VKEQPALIAIDLGAESCRVSLLRWNRGDPEIRMVRRFLNGPVEGTGGLQWNLDRICEELELGLRESAQLAPDGIGCIGVTGWAVDYVWLDPTGKPIAPPFCYRDPRNVAAFDAVHQIFPADQLYARAGVQIQPINTIYQLYADKLAGIPARAAWVNLPEYILHWLGAPRVAEYTNASHTGLVDPETRQWAADIFSTLGLDPDAAPELVPSGSVLGPLRGDLSRMRQFAKTELIAPACHDTASAIAGIPEKPGSWAYISSGTWSLVGMLLRESQRTARACQSGFTNLGAAGGNVLFHRGLVGMWLLRQCMNSLDPEGGWTLDDLISEARKQPEPDALLDLDDPEFITPGDMPARINEQRRRKGLRLLPSGCDQAPKYANLIFHSLAHRYGLVIREIEELTGERPERICVVGGGNRNEYLNALTAEATGLPVERCSVESSTLGNFAVQWARMQQGSDGVTEDLIAERARDLAGVPLCL
jgi:rhamnulokinase